MNKSTVLQDYNGNNIYPITSYQGVFGLPSVADKFKIFYGSGRPSTIMSDYNNIMINDIYIDTNAQNRVGCFHGVINLSEQNDRIYWQCFGNYIVETIDPPTNYLDYNWYYYPYPKSGVLWLNTTNNKLFSFVNWSGTELIWKDLTDFYTKPEVNALFDELRFKINKKAKPVVETVAGSTISLIDSAERSLNTISIIGRSTQNGIPTIDTPIPIIDTDSNVDVKGKNLINLSDLTNPTLNTGGISRLVVNDFIEITASKATATFGLYHGVGVPITPQEFNKAIKMRVSEGQKLFLSFQNNVFNSMNSCFINKDLDVISLIYNTTNTMVTVPSGAHWLLIRPALTNCVVGETYRDNIQVEVGTSKTDFEYYSTPQQATLTKTLRGIPVENGGNYTDNNNQQWLCDTIERYKDGTGKHIQRVARLDFDGTEDWKDTSTGSRVVLPITDAQPSTSNTPLSLNSHFNRLVNNYAAVTYNDNTYVIDINRYTLSPTINGTRLTASEWKTYLANNNNTLIYCLVEPIETPLTAEELAELELDTYYPSTTITANADVVVEYVCDTKNYIDKRMEELQNVIISQGGNV